MKYHKEKQGNWIKSDVFPIGHLADRFEDNDERVAFVKCLVDCPINDLQPCRRHQKTMPKHQTILGDRPYQNKDNEYFCQWHISAENKKGFHEPIKVVI